MDNVLLMYIHINNMTTQQRKAYFNNYGGDARNRA